MFCAVYYTLQFPRFCPLNASNLPGTVRQHKLFAASIVSTALSISLIYKQAQAAKIIGKIAVTLCVLLFASPLSVLKTVVRKQSAQSIPFPFTITCLINCFMWSVAGVFEMKDFNIYFPNMLGFASAAAQLALRMYYGDGTNRQTMPL